MAGAAERTDRTPYIIYALAAIQAAIGVYFGTRSDTQEAVQRVADRVTTIEASGPIRREMRDRQIQDLSSRVSALEERSHR
jgi:hypothetical protein